MVARKMQSGAALLGRLVTSAEAAVSAAADGANFVLLQVGQVACCSAAVAKCALAWQQYITACGICCSHTIPCMLLEAASGQECYRAMAADRAVKQAPVVAHLRCL